jgi:tetrahydromethanopterin S-methyltransferase subunit G
MTTKAADDFEAIRRRLEEIEAEQKLALTGSSAPSQTEEKKVGEYAIGWPNHYTIESVYG